MLYLAFLFFVSLVPAALLSSEAPVADSAAAAASWSVFSRPQKVFSLLRRSEEIYKLLIEKDIIWPPMTMNDLAQVRVLQLQHLAGKCPPGAPIAASSSEAVPSGILGEMR